jgi:type I restriction-modification system, S subunit (fragment)
LEVSGSKFGKIISLLSGIDFKTGDYNDLGKGTVYISGASNLSNLSNDGVLQTRWTEIPKNRAYHGDVLLVCKESGYGKTVICYVAEAHIARQIMAIKRTDLLDMKYIMYYLRANIALIKKNGQGVIPGIDRKSILTMSFPLHPVAEQTQIIEKLEELLPLCRRLN